MSHYAELKVQFFTKNESELVSALKEVYGEEGVEIHAEPTDLHLWNGARATGLTQYSGNVQDVPKCHLIVRRKSLEKALGTSTLTNDLGFHREQTGKFSVYADEVGYPLSTQNRVNQLYSAAVAERELRKLKSEGYTLQRLTESDGTIRIEATAY